MKLSRRIPARTETWTAEWCHKEWIPCSQGFRDIRAKSRNPMDKCQWCGHEFAHDEMMGLASFGSKGNKTLCGKCCDELLASELLRKDAK